MGIPRGWRLEHRASNPVSVKNLTAIETSTIVKLLRPCVPVGTKWTSKIDLSEKSYKCVSCSNWEIKFWKFQSSEHQLNIATCFVLM
jgi:hypothetical protein